MRMQVDALLRPLGQHGDDACRLANMQPGPHSKAVRRTPTPAFDTSLARKRTRPRPHEHPSPAMASTLARTIGRVQPVLGSYLRATLDQSVHPSTRLKAFDDGRRCALATLAKDCEKFRRGPKIDVSEPLLIRNDTVILNLLRSRVRFEAPIELRGFAPGSSKGSLHHPVFPRQTLPARQVLAAIGHIFVR